MARSLLLALICAAVPAMPALAQTDNVVAVGANVTLRSPGDPDEAHGSTRIGFTWRLGHAHPGWGWAYGLGWYSADVDRAIDGEPTHAGRLKIRPFMGGYGYTFAVGRTMVTASLLGGYAFTSIDQSAGLADAYRDRLGARSVQIDAANVFVVRPQVSAWYDVSRKVGIQLAAGYTIARPRVTVTSSLGEDARRLRADMFALTIGAVYSIF